MDEVQRAIQNIQLKKLRVERVMETNSEQTRRLFRWNGRDKWQYKDDFIRGKNTLWSGLPHVYESTCPAYLMSKAELHRRGFKPGTARPLAYTHNVKASVYGLYDIRDCVAIAGVAAATRRDTALSQTRKANQAPPRRKGWDVLLASLEAAAAAKG